MVSKKSIAAVLLLGIALIAVIATAGCVNTEVTGPADKVFLGNVITVDDANPVAEAVAVKDGIILFVGSKKDAEKFCDENTEVIDFGDNSIYPGFLEAHAHVSLAGMRSFGMAKLTPGAPLKQTVDEIAAYIKENPGKDYYIGSGWTFSGGEEPTAAMLDAVCSDVPVILQTQDGHSVWVNSKCIEALNPTQEQIEAYGPAQIRVDANGKPTGYLSETPAIEMLKDLPFTVEDLKEFTLKWQEEGLSDGFTGVSDAGMELFGAKQIDAYEQLIDEDALKLRIYGLSMVNDNTDTPEEDMAKIAELAERLNSDHFKVIGAKVFLDGVIEAHSGWMLDEYKDQAGYYGVSRFNDVDKMARLMIAADKYGMLVHAHSVGDAANRMFADSVEKAIETTGNYDQRNAAAHLQYLKPEDIERFGELGIIAVSGYQWTAKNEFSYPVEQKAVGADYAEKGYPAQSFINAGAVVVGHTDYPVSPVVSIPNAFYTGVTRTSPLIGDEGIRGPEEAMSREDTLKSLTSNVAYMWHEEDRLGSLEPGKLADMTVLSVDLLHDDMDTVGLAMLIPAVATIIDGEIVYQADADAAETA
ncbi:MAG: amidohydrolase [Methanocorpusculum sp.]|nr:amidohydrolase [Methanocorpusculum sp.]